MKIIFLIFISIYLYIVGRDAYLVWFKPGLFIENQNEFLEWYFNTLPFMKVFRVIPRANGVLQINRLILPVILVFCLFFLIFLLQIFLKYKFQKIL
jgi:hypothetical protein